MGFDLLGIAATSKKGEYFRNNCWYWRPLWVFVCDVCYDILTEKDMSEGNWNNGYSITKKKATAIAEKLEETIKDGRAKEHAKAVQLAIRKAKTTNKGKRAGDKGYDWNECYPFTVQNVREFTEFCRDSGGFSIG